MGLVDNTQAVGGYTKASDYSESDDANSLSGKVYAHCPAQKCSSKNRSGDRDSDESESGDVDGDASTEIVSKSCGPLSSSMCPICLSENQILPYENNAAIQCESSNIVSVDGNVDGASGIEEMESERSVQVQGANECVSERFLYQNQHGVPMFQLASCEHIFCAPCLYAYIQSKLMEGTLQVLCCHFVIPEKTDDFRVCNVEILESDLLQLIGMGQYLDTCRLENTCWVTDGGCKMIETNESSLKKKFEKLKFDQHHGKDCVRRCPKCDEPQLFDAEKMKTYDANLIFQNRVASAGNVTDQAGEGRRSNVDSRTILGRIFSVVGVRGMGNRLSCALEESTFSNGVASAADSSASHENLNKPSETPITEKSIEETHDEREPSSLLSVSTRPIVNCKKCSLEFCYFHSNAHPGLTCKRYNENSAELDRVNVTYAHETMHSKQCPKCGILVSKEGGCNQIKCGNCGVHFCWLCLAEVDSGAFPEHFRWWNLRGCPNMQLDASEQVRYWLCLLLFISILHLLIDIVILST